MGRPLAQVPDPAGDCHASYARHFAGIFIDTFSGLGIHPERYYWMSDIYPTGDMDPFIRTALDRAAAVREIYRRVANVQHPDTWHPLQVVCENCGKIGTTIVTDWDGERVFYECRERLVTWATRLRPLRLDVAVRRAGEAAVEPRVGGPVVAVRRDDRAVRQGPLDRRRVARPLRRDRPRGLRARAAAQRPVRVHQHRRQEDVDLEGARRRGPRDRRRDQARAAPVLLPPTEAEPRGRLRPDRAPTRSRGSTTSSTASRPPRPARRSAARSRPGFENTFRYSLLDPDADVAAEAARFRPAVRPPRAAAPGPERRRRGAGRGGEGEPARRARADRSSTSGSTRPVRGWRRTRRSARSARRPPRRRCPTRRADLDDAQRRYLAALADAVAADGADRPATAGRTRSSRRPPTPASRRSRRSPRSTSRSSAGRTDRVRAGCLRASIRGFVVERLREAGQAPVGGAA